MNFAEISLVFAPAATPRYDAFEKTIPELQEAMERGEVSSRELVRQYLERIEAFDRGGPALNSLIYVNPRALEEADALDRERRERGPRGPLHGIPIVLKDNYDTKDMPTTASSVALTGFVPKDDGFQVRKLREAGALFLAKSNLHGPARSKRHRSRPRPGCDRRTGSRGSTDLGRGRTDSGELPPVPQTRRVEGQEAGALEELSPGHPSGKGDDGRRSRRRRGDEEGGGGGGSDRDGVQVRPRGLPRSRGRSSGEEPGRNPRPRTVPRCSRPHLPHFERREGELGGVSEGALPQERRSERAPSGDEETPTRRHRLPHASREAGARRRAAAGKLMYRKRPLGPSRIQHPRRVYPGRGSRGDRASGKRVR